MDFCKVVMYLCNSYTMDLAKQFLHKIGLLQLINHCIQFTLKSGYWIIVYKVPFAKQLLCTMYITKQLLHTMDLYQTGVIRYHLCKTVVYNTMNLCKALVVCSVRFGCCHIGPTMYLCKAVAIGPLQGCLCKVVTIYNGPLQSSYCIQCTFKSSYCLQCTFAK